MASPPPNPDTRELPYGWMQQYNWEYRQWYYVNTREQPPRSSWEHPLGPLLAAPLGPPPTDRSYNRSPYGQPPPPQQGYGGYQGYQPPSYGQPPPQGYYNGPQGGFGRPTYDNRAYPQERVVYQEPRQQKKGPGLGTAVAAGGAGLLGGFLLTEAIESHDEREREEGFDQGYQDGWQDSNQYDDFGGDGGGW